MITLQKIKTVWANKWHILKALFTLYFIRDKNIRLQIKKRVSMCESNACGYYDQKGASEKVIIKGKPESDGRISQEEIKAYEH